MLSVLRPLPVPATCAAVCVCVCLQPGHGSFTPLAVGLSLVACAGTGAKYTGAALNPARVIGEGGWG